MSLPIAGLGRGDGALCYLMAPLVIPSMKRYRDEL